MPCKNICRVSSFFMGLSSYNGQNPERRFDLLPQAWLSRGSRHIGLTSGIKPAAASPDNQTFL
jgi:hypothetical protein